MLEWTYNSRGNLQATDELRKYVIKNHQNQVHDYIQCNLTVWEGEDCILVCKCTGEEVAKAIAGFFSKGEF